MTDRELPLPEDEPTVPVWPTAGRALGLSKNAAYRAAHAGQIPAIHLGSRWLVPTAKLRALLGLDDASQ